MQNPSPALPPLRPTPPPALQTPPPTPAPVVRSAISIVAPVASAVLATLSDSADTIITSTIVDDENQSTATESELPVESSASTTVPGPKTVGIPVESMTPTTDSKPVSTEYGTTSSITTLSESESESEAVGVCTSTTSSEPETTGVRAGSGASTSTLGLGLPVGSGGLTTTPGLEVADTLSKSRTPTSILRSDIPIESKSSTIISEPRSTGIPAKSKTSATLGSWVWPFQTETTGILTESGTTTTAEATTIPTEPAISTTTSATVDPSVRPRPASAGIHAPAAPTNISVPVAAPTGQSRSPALAPTVTTVTANTTATFPEIDLTIAAPAGGNSTARYSTPSRASQSSTTPISLPVVASIETVSPALIPESTPPTSPPPPPIAPESANARPTTPTTFLKTTTTALPKPLQPTTPTPIAVVILITRASAIPASAEVTAGTSVDKDGNQIEILAFYDATSGETFGADRDTVFDGGVGGVSVPVWIIVAALGGQLLLL